MLQRYVSKELTHFVGASLRSDENAQYQLFRDILRSSTLRNPKFGEGFAYSTSPLANELGESLSAPIVCFCDIPSQDLQIHSAKYGRFGIAFRKEFLVKQGATPVFYVAKTAVTLPLLNLMFKFDRPISDRGPGATPQGIAMERRSRLELFELWKYASTSMYFAMSSSQPQNSTYEFMRGGWWSDYYEFLSLYVFGYVKYIDVGLEDDDPTNFYMEREWRVLNEARFLISDITRVLIPEQFAQTFRSDFPDYFGQVTFIE